MRGNVLTVEDRDEILRGICENLSDRSIAAQLGRNQSVISREITRNGGRGKYRVHAAQERYETLRARPKPRKLEKSRRLHDAVAHKLRDDFSPEQVSGRLKEDHPEEPEMHVSHETIYQALFLQARGELRTQLKLALRTGRVRRVPRGSSRPKQARIADMVNISERPAEVEDRAVPGHWEGDLIIGKGGKSQVATILSRRIGGLPEQLRRSLAWDQDGKWPAMPGSRSPRTFRCSSVILIPRGSVEVMRILTGYSGSIFRRVAICRATLKPNSMRSRRS